MSPSRIGPAVVKEFRQFVRDPVLLILVMWLYTVEVVLCSVSLTFDLKEEPLGALDLDRSVASRELIGALDRSSSFDVRFRPAGEAEAGELLERGRARMVVVVPRGFGERLGRGEAADLQLLVDGTNSMVAMTALGVARRQVTAFSLRRPWLAGTPGLAAATAGAPFHIENRMRLWYNPDLRFVYFVVISMIALAAYMVGVIHPAASIVKEKERGTIEQLAVSPLTPTELTPVESMPAALQLLSRLSPLRYYMEALLGVFLKGVGIDVLWPQLLWMAGLGVVLFAGSFALFRRRLV